MDVSAEAATSAKSCARRRRREARTEIYEDHDRPVWEFVWKHALDETRQDIIVSCINPFGVRELSTVRVAVLHINDLARQRIDNNGGGHRVVILWENDFSRSEYTSSSCHPRYVCRHEIDSRRQQEERILPAMV